MERRSDSKAEGYDAKRKLVDSPGSRSANYSQEVKLLIAKTNETPLDPFDIISDRRSVTALCLMYSSMVSPSLCFRHEA